MRYTRLRRAFLANVQGKPAPKVKAESTHTLEHIHETALHRPKPMPQPATRPKEPEKKADAVWISRKSIYLLVAGIAIGTIATAWLMSSSLTVPAIAVSKSVVEGPNVSSMLVSSLLKLLTSEQPSIATQLIGGYLGLNFLAHQQAQSSVFGGLLGLVPTPNITNSGWLRSFIPGASLKSLGTKALGLTTTCTTFLLSTVLSPENIICNIPGIQQVFRQGKYEREFDADMSEWREAAMGLKARLTNATYVLTDDDKDILYDLYCDERYEQNRDSLKSADINTLMHTVENRRWMSRE